MWDIATSGDTKYPFWWVVPQTSTAKNGEVGFNFLMIVMDREKKDKSNYQEVLNDTSLICLDILSELKRGSSNTYTFDIKFENGFTLTPFSERFDDEVTGWSFPVTVWVPWDQSECAIP